MNATRVWHDFCVKYKIDESTPYEAWSFGGDPDKLADLVIKGIKTATASAYDLYTLDPDEPMPKVGDYSVILNSKEEALCVIQTIKLTVVPFSKVSEEHAYKEGEGDRSLAYWREVHEDFFKKECVEYNMNFSTEMNVLCEEFKLLYIHRNKKYKPRKYKKFSSCMTSEDIDMFREREQESNTKKLKNICDTHQDGA